MPTEEELTHCDLCGQPLDEGCKPLKESVSKSEYNEYLTKEDVKEIRDVYHRVYLPVLHSVLLRAKSRNIKGTET